MVRFRAGSKGFLGGVSVECVGIVYTQSCQEPLSLATVHGVLILDNDGKRIQCKVCTVTWSLRLHGACSLPFLVCSITLRPFQH